MNLLLDTHALLWLLQGNSRLPKIIRELVVDVENNCFVSIASLWEITVKASLGKLSLKRDLKDIYELLSENEIQPIPIRYAHLQQLIGLKFIHRDPFDRLIIAQANVEQLTIITKDRRFEEYGVEIRW